MSKFNINIAKLAIQLLPMCLRGNRMKGFVKACAEPLKYVGDAFEDYREGSDYRLTHNSQVCYLKAVLNDKFDPLLRGITILRRASDNLRAGGRDTSHHVSEELRRLKGDMLQGQATAQTAGKSQRI